MDEEALRRIVASPDRVEPGVNAGVHSYLMVPLLARGIVLGGAEFIRIRNPVPFGQADRALAEELAARTALAMDNARLYRRERDTADPAAQPAAAGDPPHPRPGDRLPLPAQQRGQRGRRRLVRRRAALLRPGRPGGRRRDGPRHPRRRHHGPTPHGRPDVDHP
ncbi:GAF domain-containing protein [Kitasatospora aburaviensis]